MPINMNDTKQLAEMGVNLIIRESSDTGMLKEIIQIAVQKKNNITVSSRCFSGYEMKDIVEIGEEYLTIIVE